MICSIEKNCLYFIEQNRIYKIGRAWWLETIYLELRKEGL